MIALEILYALIVPALAYTGCKSLLKELPVINLPLIWSAVIIGVLFVPRIIATRLAVPDLTLEATFFLNIFSIYTISTHKDEHPSHKYFLLFIGSILAYIYVSRQDTFMHRVILAWTFADTTQALYTLVSIYTGSRYTITVPLELVLMLPAYMDVYTRATSGWVGISAEVIVYTFVLFIIHEFVAVPRTIPESVTREDIIPVKIPELPAPQPELPAPEEVPEPPKPEKPPNPLELPFDWDFTLPEKVPEKVPVNTA